jgi:hypothetical protein
MNSESFKNWAEGAQAVASVAALGVGALWAWAAFVRRRLQFPKAVVVQAVSHHRLSPEKTLLRVNICIANRGDVVLPVRSMMVRVQQVLPVPPQIGAKLGGAGDLVPKNQTSIPWDPINKSLREWDPGDHEVEPGEEESTAFDFVIDGGVRTVEVYTFVRNAVKRKREVGWGSTTLYDLGGPDGRQ